jgi:hypothetical protein
MPPATPIAHGAGRKGGVYEGVRGSDLLSNNLDSSPPSGRKGIFVEITEGRNMEGRYDRHLSVSLAVFKIARLFFLSYRQDKQVTHVASRITSLKTLL